MFKLKDDSHNMVPIIVGTKRTTKDYIAYLVLRNVEFLMNRSLFYTLVFNKVNILIVNSNGINANHFEE